MGDHHPALGHHLLHLAEAEREADDGVDVEAEAGRGDVENDEHPDDEDGPGENRKQGDVIGRDDEVGADA